MKKTPYLVTVPDYHDFPTLNTKRIKVVEIGFEPFLQGSQYVGLAYTIGNKPSKSVIKQLIKKQYPNHDPCEILND